MNSFEGQTPHADEDINEKDGERNLNHLQGNEYNSLQ